MENELENKFNVFNSKRILWWNWLCLHHQNGEIHEQPKIHDILLINDIKLYVQFYPHLVNSKIMTSSLLVKFV